MNKIILFIFFISIFLTSCKKNNQVPEGVDFREEMRAFVIDLSDYSKSYNGDFLIIPQNGQELMTSNGEADGSVYNDYLNCMDATGRENLFYGYDHDDEPTPEGDQQHLLDLCSLCEDFEIEVLTTDYCFSHDKMNHSYSINNAKGFISFAASQRELNNIPDYPIAPYNENAENISDVSEAKNFLYLINTEKYSTKSEFLNALSHTNYDLLIVDLFFEDTQLTLSDIEQLRQKSNGGSRLVICYMSIGEAEDYRYYWDKNWNNERPFWLGDENPDWEGNYKVWYWEKEWQELISGNNDSYLYRIIEAGFDGVYLDLIDAFEYFEENN